MIEPEAERRAESEPVSFADGAERKINDRKA